MPRLCRPHGLTGRLLVTWLMQHRTELSETGCLLWTGYVRPEGYGTLGYDGGTHYAHRLIKMILHGSPESPDLVADHICRTRACVNPDHLRWVTARQNSLENNESPLAANARKKACPKCGGEYENAYGARLCRTCRNANSLEWFHKHGYKNRKARNSHP